MQRFCENCGMLIEKRQGLRPYLYAKRKFCSWKCRSGVYHHQWEGGRFKVSKGYVRVRTSIGRTNYEHRVIAERVLGRPLKRGETVHHINGDKQDNRNCNLLVCSNSYHRFLHERMSLLYAQEHFGAI